MTRIYTRSGDNGSTGLANGQRVAKTSARIGAIGTVDECNAHLGMLVSLIDDSELARHLVLIQHQLFDLGATLAGVPESLIKARHVSALEKYIDELAAAVPPLKHFVLPGGSSAAAQAHISRAVCRRAERLAFALANTESIPAEVVQFLNRLSDFLFLVARTLSQGQNEHQGGEVRWAPEGER